MIHRRKKRAEIIIGSNISAIIVEINNKENCNNRKNIEKDLIKGNYDITDLDKGKEIINEEENIKITITTINIHKNNGSVKPIVQNKLNQIQQNVKTKKQNTSTRVFTHQKMKHRQNSTSRRLRPRFRQQQKQKFLQSQRSKENSGPKKNIANVSFSRFHFFAFFNLYIYILSYIIFK